MDLVDRYGSWLVVAGASAGLGLRIAQEGARRGFNVVLIARRAELVEAMAGEISRDFGVQTRALPVNLADSGATAAIASATSDIDVGAFVYNAAAEPVGGFLGLSVNKHSAAIAVNCTTPTSLVHHFGTLMRERARGSITLVTSIGAFFGSRLVSSYAATKAYQLNLAEGLWDELRPLGVDVQAFVVGATATPNYFRPSPEALSTQLESIEVDDMLATLVNRGAHPMDPAIVAERLFESLGLGPTVFASPIDERLIARFHAVQRSEPVRIQGALIQRMLDRQG
ncbi:MAG: SDR family NAD(P)-dependent oxidoreductase [Acidimicrobiia bacterium]